MSDCLICLAPTRNKWTPEVPCTCRPTMHRRCWERWVDRMGPICIICRTHENGRAPPPQPRHIVVIQPAAAPPPPIPVPLLYRCYGRVVALIEITFLILIFVLIIRIMAMHGTATQNQRLQFRSPGPIPLYPPLQPNPFELPPAAPHDEL